MQGLFTSPKQTSRVYNPGDAARCGIDFVMLDGKRVANDRVIACSPDEGWIHLDSDECVTQFGSVQVFPEVSGC